LAYASCEGIYTCNVNVVRLDEAFVPRSAPRQLTTRPFLLVGSLVWARDGKSVVFSSFIAVFVSYLWRVDVDGNRPVERLELAGVGALTPATVPSKDQLAFTRVSYDLDVYRFEAGGPVRSVLASSFPDTEPRLSPDGRRVAFCSGRSGEHSAVWVANSDGTDAQQLTHGPGTGQGSPWWSPDGRRIAFDSRGDDDGHLHIWIIDANGGTLHQLTTGHTDQVVPTWSRDGRWIYFWEAGNIRRVAATGGPTQQITSGGSGRFACESADGKSLLFQPTHGDSPLLMMPFSGGPPRQLVACVKKTAFVASAHGVFYVPCDPSADPPLHVLDPDTGRDHLLGKLDNFETHSPAALAQRRFSSVLPREP
jgi:Tol biopolymer transport system component